MKKATSLGLVVIKPLGDSMPYDIVVDNGSCLWRVQVKSSRFRVGGGFDVTTRRSAGRKLYRASELDFVAAYIIPEDVWYIIPIREVVRRHAIRVYPHKGNSRGRYHKYREAWRLLLPKPSPRRIFAQADTGTWNEIPSHDFYGPAASGGNPELLSQFGADPQRDRRLLSQHELHRVKRQPSPSRPERNFVLRDEQRRMPEAEQLHHCQIKALLICADDQAIVVSREPLHLPALPSP